MLLEVQTLKYRLDATRFFFQRALIDFQSSVTSSCRFFFCFFFMASAFGVVFYSNRHSLVFFRVLVRCCGLVRVANTSLKKFSREIFFFFSIFFLCFALVCSPLFLHLLFPSLSSSFFLSVCRI